MPGTATFIEKLLGKNQKSTGVAIALAKFNYVMGSDYRHLMISGFSSEAMVKRLNTLKEDVQKREFIRYGTSEENTLYKTTIIDYIDRIINMNLNFEFENTMLRYKLNEVGNEVTEAEAIYINGQLSP